MPKAFRLRVAPASPTRRWRLPVFVFVIVLALSAALAAQAMVRVRRGHEAGLAAEGRAVVIAIEASVDEALERSRSVAALFRASAVVTDAEFASFATDLGYSAGMFGIGYIALVDAAGFDRFQSRLTADHPGSIVFELDGLQPVPRSPQEQYFPIQYFVSPEGLPAWGFDVGSDPVFRETLRMCLVRGEGAATPFLTFPGRPGDDGFVIFQPFIDDGVVVGVVAVGLDLSDLLGVLHSSAPDHAGDLPRVIDAASSGSESSGDWASEIVVADRTWRVVLDHTAPSPHLVAIGIMAVGLVTASALAFATALVGDRIRQRREVEDLRALDRQKDEFLATVSHELRTPLTSVVGFATELADPPVGLSDRERHDMVHIIRDEAVSMEGIVQDLLAASRLGQGSALPVAVERIPDLVAEVSALAVGRHTARILASHADGIAVIADPARVRQIIRNLLENAVRHGAPPVIVSVARIGSIVELSVSDAGRGIPDEVRTSLFERYRSATRDPGRPASTGIGLWVSRELARRMGGELIWVPSDRGACFVLTLPSAAEPALAAGF